jgi:hypothetical protein
MTFRILPLPRESFAELFSLSDEALKERNALRVVADANPGFPCRVSLVDAEIGETVLLLNYEHQPARTPFRAAHAIFVRERAVEARCAPGEVPALFRSRMMSLRGFDERHMFCAGDLVSGTELAEAIERMLAQPSVSYVHLHYAKLGCYAARAERA